MKLNKKSKGPRTAKINLHQYVIFLNRQIWMLQILSLFYNISAPSAKANLKNSVFLP